MNTVKVRDLVLGDGVPKICVPVIAHTYQELEKALNQLEGSPYDLVEFRADFYFEEEDRALERIRSCIGSRPLLYTLRTSEEGGEIAPGEEAYQARILSAAGKADLVDIQLARLHPEEGVARHSGALIKAVHRTQAKVILSWHDFEKTPDRQALSDTLRAMQRAGCDIAKIAVMPKNRLDVLALMEASVRMYEDPDACPFITMSMGTLGKVTRVAALLTGSCITFGTAGSMSAPGQIPSEKLREILRSLT